MRFEILDGNLSSARVDCVVVGLQEGAELSTMARGLGAGVTSRLKSLADRGDLSTRLCDTQLLVDVDGLRAPRLIVVGLGAARSFDRRAWRRAVSAALAAVLRTRATSVALGLDRPAGTQLDDYYFGRATAELTGAAMYRVNDLKSGKKPRTPSLERVVAGPVAPSGVAAARRGMAHGVVVADGMGLLRDLGNLPGNICTPRYLAAQAQALAKKHRSLRVKVLDEAAIKREKMGCLLSVSAGSDEPARFIVMEHRGGRKGAAPVVLVGKGVTSTPAASR